jgi:hypothetical protein
LSPYNELRGNYYLEKLITLISTVFSKNFELDIFFELKKRKEKEKDGISNIFASFVYEQFSCHISAFIHETFLLGPPETFLGKTWAL